MPNSYFKNKFRHLSHICMFKKDIQIFGKMAAILKKYHSQFEETRSSD